MEELCTHPFPAWPQAPGTALGSAQGLGTVTKQGQCWSSETYQQAQTASPRSCVPGQSEVHTDAVRGQHPSGGPGTVSPPCPASSWVSEVCAFGPFYR